MIPHLDLSSWVTIIAALIASPFIVAAWKYFSEIVTGLFSRKQWRAIFLTNGQVYFGQATRTTEREMALEKIYYLRPNDNPSGDQKIEEIGLIRLGGELHKPKGKMTISLAQILFWEEIEEGGDLVKKIKELETLTKK